MTSLHISLESLSHNAGLVRELYSGLSVRVLPVLKELAGHPALRNTLRDHGFVRFAFASILEPVFFGAAGAGLPEEQVLIQLSLPAQAAQVVANFHRSHQSTPETLRALDQAAGALGLTHEVIIMVNLGDQREGLEPEELDAVLREAGALSRLKVAGLGLTLACLNHHSRPDQALLNRLGGLHQLFKARLKTEPEISVGGSVFHNWLMAQKESWPITEARMGDPFLMGLDIYRQEDLSGGSFRYDVCSLSAEILEIRTRQTTSGPRVRALLNVGHFQLGPATGRQSDDPMNGLDCLWPGASLDALSAGYAALDITNCPERPKLGQEIFFRPGYLVAARAIRHPAVKIAFTGQNASDELPPGRFGQ